MDLDQHVGGGELTVKVAEEVHARADPVLIVVMGVSGCGKSTMGAMLAGALGIPFTDADALHPQTNIDKMSRGVPLTDADRQPWLEHVRAEAVHTCELQEGRRGIVVGCSALKRSYRDVLRGYSQCGADATRLATYFVHLGGTRAALLSRMENRKGHFMKADMLDSQLATLERPEETGEGNVVTVDLEACSDEQIGEAIGGLRRLGALHRLFM